jgi:Zn-dependent protease with chaperone function
MNPAQNPTQDFKKWITFNNSLSDHKNLYDLYNAVKDIRTASETRCTPLRQDDITKYLIECSAVGDSLIVEEEGRQELLSYLKQHYFRTENIDEWFRRKQSLQDKTSNHQYLPNEDDSFTNNANHASIHPHYKETRYYNIKVLFSALCYLAIIGFLAITFLQSPVKGAAYLFSFALAAFSLVLLQWIAKGFMIGLIKGNAVRVTAKQNPMIFQIISTQVKQLGLKEMPEVYMYGGVFNAFVMKFARTHVLMLYSQVIETAMNGDDSILKFVIGHELGHIKRKHLAKRSWLIFSNLIPFLGKAYSRGCEYTCDRIGYHFSKQGAIEGVLILATGKEIYSLINIDQFVDESVNSGSFWMWFSEKFLSHPHTSKRLAELRKYAQASS